MHNENNNGNGSNKGIILVDKILVSSLAAASMTFFVPHCKIILQEKPAIVRSHEAAVELNQKLRKSLKEKVEILNQGHGKTNGLEKEIARIRNVLHAVGDEIYAIEESREYNLYLENVENNYENGFYYAALATFVAISGVLLASQYNKQKEGENNLV